jgi:hypothetical protein
MCYVALLIILYKIRDVTNTENIKFLMYVVVNISMDVTSSVQFTVVKWGRFGCS